MRCPLSLLTLSGLWLASNAAHAQEVRPSRVSLVAVEPVPERQPATFIAARADGGVAIPAALDAVGGYARLAAEAVFVADHDRFSPVAGFWDGLEGVGLPDFSGFAFPVALFGGVKTPRVIATLGGGFNLFTVDRLHDHTGFGILSPRANMRLGLHLGPLWLNAEAGVQHRWQWGTEATTLVQAGLSIGFIRREPGTERRER